jgi:DNA-binding NarL/FixJ family response regulator
LIDQYEVIYGEIARALALRAAEPLAVDNDTLLQQAGLLESVPEQVRIVLVDDHFLFSDGMARLLEAQSDMKVVGTAGSLSEAMALIPNVLPHLVLMDIALPDGSGIEATRAILEIAPGTKVVILTVNEDEEQVFEAIRAGAIGYLFKSVRAVELVETLRGVMSGEVGIRGSTARRVMAEFARLSPGSADRGVTLTAREVEVLRELAEGATNQEIAKRLVISENTVKNHIRNVLFKLHLHSRRDAGEYARRHGLTSRRRPP